MEGENQRKPAANPEFRQGGRRPSPARKGRGPSPVRGGRRPSPVRGGRGPSPVRRQEFKYCLTNGCRKNCRVRVHVVESVARKIPCPFGSNCRNKEGDECLGIHDDSCKTVVCSYDEDCTKEKCTSLHPKRESDLSVISGGDSKDNKTVARAFPNDGLTSFDNVLCIRLEHCKNLSCRCAFHRLEDLTTIHCPVKDCGCTMQHGQGAGKKGVCFYFRKDGLCRNGEKCEFSHTIHHPALSAKK